MNVKKLIKSIIIILLSIFIIGCNNNKNNIQETFDIENATNVGKEYMKEYARIREKNKGRKSKWDIYILQAMGKLFGM